MELNHELRAKGIGSSEIAMIVEVDGKPLSPWGGPHRLWRLKTGREEWKESSNDMKFGTKMESVIAEWYAEENGYDIKEVETMQHQKYPVVIDSCDRLAFRGNALKRCVEAKAVHFTKKGEWGTPGTDEIPDYYMTQAQWHLGVHMPEDGICDVPVMFDRKIEYYHIAFDEELFLCLVETAEKFWVDHVVADVEPAYDSPGDAVSWLSKYLKNKKPGLLDAEEATVKVMIQYRQSLLDIDALESEADAFKSILMTECGEYGGLVMPGGAKITWARSKDSESVDWKKVAEEIGGKLSPQELVNAMASNKKIRKGSRRWVPTSLKGMKV